EVIRSNLAGDDEKSKRHLLALEDGKRISVLAGIRIVKSDEGALRWRRRGTLYYAVQLLRCYEFKADRLQKPNLILEFVQRKRVIVRDVLQRNRRRRNNPMIRKHDATGAGKTEF